MFAQFGPVSLIVILLVAFLMFRPMGVQTMPATTSSIQQNVPKEMVQIQFGNGMVRQRPVGEPSATCTKGTELDLTQAGVDLQGSGYYFASKWHHLAPSIREINGKEQVYQVSLGHPSEYVVFLLPKTGGIAAVQMSENVPSPMNITTTSYQGWKIVTVGDRVSMVYADTKLWLTRSGNSFCVEFQTPVDPADTGIFNFFVKNGVLPQGEEIEKFFN